MKVDPMEVEGQSDVAHRDKRKKLVRILAAIIGILSILCLTFIILYATKDSSSDKDSGNHANANNAQNGRGLPDGGTTKAAPPATKTVPGSTKDAAVSNGTTTSSNPPSQEPAVSTGTTTSSTPPPPQEPVCNSTACKRAVESIQAKWDDSVDPCEDFSLYACGNFYRTAKIDADRTYAGSFLEAFESIRDLKQRLLESSADGLPKDGFEYKMKAFYNACIDEEAIEKHGLQDYKDEYRKDWPTLNAQWNDTSFDLQKDTEDATGRFFYVLFYLYKTVEHDGEKDRYMLEMDHPYFLLDRDILLEERNSTKVMAYQNYYKDFAIALGADEATAEEDAKKVIDVYREIAKASMSPEDQMNVTLTTNPTTLENMNAKYTYLNWTSVIQSLYSDGSKEINGKQKVNVGDLNYFKSLEKILNDIDKRTLQNMFGFKNANSIVGSATKKMRKIWMDFQKVRNGLEKEAPRVEQCSDWVDSVYNLGMAKLISRKRFSTKAKNFMDNLIKNLKMAYKESLETVPWMQNDTKRQAVLKLEKMAAKIGIPDQGFDVADIDDWFKDNVITGNYQTDKLQGNRQHSIRSWSFLNEEIQKWRWDTSITAVNAFNEPQRNELVFPLGILQNPFFDQTRPGYLNYGAIGQVIGHEIGHGFDTNGRNYDERGDLRDWWTADDSKDFDNRAQCFIDQYNHFDLQIGDKTYNANGKLTKTENIADSLGIVQAYRAYQHYASDEGKTEKTLPELGLTKDQLFFVSLAQGWCEINKPETMLNYLRSDPHSNPKLRIIGMVQNSKGFADAFQCKPNTKMNPRDRCTLW